MNEFRQRVDKWNYKGGMGVTNHKTIALQKPRKGREKASEMDEGRKEGGGEDDSN